MRRMVWVVAVSVALAMALSGTAVAAQGEPLSKKDYIKAADNICRQANQLRDETATSDFADIPAGGQPTLEQMTTYITDIDPINRQELDGLRELPATSGEKKKVKKVYKAVEKGFDAIFADPGLLLSDTNPFAKADKLAQKYGFKVCGSSSG
ncbi:MAG: hypothetical protein EXQ79_01955 [Acidimicrobiia bacterium]|nr:hypothetical protein [Acidimicrobiia bacterium]